jgi:hypothetical protein
MEGFYLFYEHDYVKGIFAVSSLYMVQVTVIDYMMKLSVRYLILSRSSADVKRKKTKKKKGNLIYSRSNNISHFQRTLESTRIDSPNRRKRRRLPLLQHI